MYNSAFLQTALKHQLFFAGMLGDLSLTIISDLYIQQVVRKPSVVLPETLLTFPTKRRPACSSGCGSQGYMSFSMQRWRQNICDTFVSHIFWYQKNIFPLVCRHMHLNTGTQHAQTHAPCSHTCWWCVAGRTGVNSLPGAQRAAGRCKRETEAANLCPEWNCMALRRSTRKQRGGFYVYFHLLRSSNHYIRKICRRVCKLTVCWCKSNFVSLMWCVYRFEAFLHDHGAQRGPDSDVVPVVASDQVWHL